MATYPSISKVQGNLYAQTNTLSTDYGSGQLWCDNDIIIQDATTTDTRNIKTLGANLTVTAGNALVLASTGNTTVNANTGSSSFTVNAGSGGISLTNSGSSSVGVSGANITLTSGGAGTLNMASFQNINATGSAGTTNISNATTTIQGTSALNLGNDTNTGTITLGSSNKTLNIAAATTISGNLNVTGTTTTMNSTNTTYTDNVITLHALPTSQADSVVLYQRYPTDVVTESTTNSNGATYAYTLTCTSVSTGTSLTCSAIGGATVLTIIGCMIQNNSNNLYVTAATGTGPYTLTVSAPFTVATGTSVLAYCRLSAGLLYTENASTKGFNLAYYQAIGETAGDFSVSQQPAYADLRCNNIFASGSISGAGSGGSYSFQVSIVSTTGAAQTLPSTYAAVTTTGSYMVIISPVVAGNATATFMISKALASLSNGNVFRLTSAAGTNGAGPFEELGMQWGANILPQVYLSTLGTQGSITYNVRVIAN